MPLQLKEAEAVLTDNNRKRSGSNSAQAGPVTVEAIFNAAAAAAEPAAAPPEPNPTVSAEPVQPQVQSERPTELVQLSAQSPENQTNLPPLISPPASPRLVASYRDTPLSPSALIKSDSEGLAPSVDGEASIESDDEFQRSLLPPSTVQPTASGATVAAVRQAFLRHTQQQRRDLRQLSPLQRAEADTYEPQPLHSSGTTPAYVPYHPLEDPLVRRNDPRISPNNRRRVPIRERPRSPHALPHPLEHYQRLLNSGDPRQQAVTQLHVHPQPHSSPPSIGDLDSRIAQILGNARGDLAIRPSNPTLTQQCTQQQQQQSHPLPPIGVLSQPPPPPPLASSQNVILSPYGSVPPPPPLPIPPPVMMHPSIPPPFVPHGIPMMPEPPPSTVFIPTSPLPTTGSMVRPLDPQNMWPHSQKQQQQQRYNGSRPNEICRQTDI